MTMEDGARERLRDAVQDVRPDPSAWSRIDFTVRRRRAARAIVAAAAGVAIVVSGIQWAGPAHEGALVSPDAEGSVTYRHPDGWSWTYPSSWDEQRVAYTVRITVDTIRISTASLGQDVSGVHPEEGPPDTTLQMPPNAVTLSMEFSDGGPPPLPTDEPETVFPVAFDDGDVITAEDGAEVISWPIVREGVIRHSLNLWVGNDAPEEMVSAARDVISSMEWGRLEDGYCRERACPVADLRGREARDAVLADADVQRRVDGHEYRLEAESDVAYGSGGGLCSWLCHLFALDLPEEDRTLQIWVAEPRLSVTIVEQLTEDEAAQAHVIADADPEVLASVGTEHHHEIPGAPPSLEVHRPAAHHIGPDKHYPCASPRCAVVQYYLPTSDDRLVRMLSALVDLVDRVVLQTEKQTCDERDAPDECRRGW